MTSPFVPTDEQRVAIEHPPSPLLVVAGAGTGKTTVMAERIVHLVRSGACTADEVLGLTFTNKAALHLRRAILERLGTDADVTVSTYHAFGADLVASHALELDLDPRTTILDKAQAWQLLFAVFDEFRFDARRTFNPGLIVDHALDLASRCSDHLVAVGAVEADCADIAANAKWKTFRDATAKRAELCQVVARYEERKRERHLLDYGDQIALAVRLLHQHPDVADALREQHRVVLLDEYQDTNYAQRVLLQALCPPGSAVTAVGDDMQSIYGFRGAHLGNILCFEEHFPPVARLPLTLNRRSGPALVDLANRIQATVGRRLEGKVLRAMDDAPAGRAECFLAADDAEEAATVADDILAMGPPWSERAVLCRKRRLIPPIAAALEAAGVPVEVVGTSGLLDRPEVVDLVAWLEVLADLGSSVALVRLLEGPRHRIGRRDLAALARHARSLREPDDRDVPSLADAIADHERVADLSPAARTRLAAFDAERRTLAAAAARLPVLDLCEAIAARTGLWHASGERGRENVLRLLDLAARFVPVDGAAGLAAFVEYLHLVDESEEDVAEARIGDRDAVRVMTVHQAKGLEFDAVWVPGLTKGSFPDNRAGDNAMSNGASLPWWLRPDPEGMPHWREVAKLADVTDEVRRRRDDEERRLLYVACTRARRRLVVSAAHWYPGASTPQGPSPFFEDVARESDIVTTRFRHDPPEVDPDLADKQRRLAAAASRYGAPAVTADPPATLFDDATLPVVAPAAVRRAPDGLSVTSLVSFARCPRQFHWTVVRPLPRAPSPAARVGTIVHRWIERRGAPQLALLEPDEEPDADDGPASGVTDALRRSFLATPYAALDPVAVERPFVLVAGGRVVRGRVDAVYGRDGRVELVDFKTGREPATGDPGAHTQLDLYALAAVDAWRHDPGLLRTTFCYLRADAPPALVSSDWDAERVDAVRAALGDALAAVGAGDRTTNPGAWCGRCDFADVCESAPG